ncbi:MAG: flavodoxin family protein [Lentisphaeria bacterium]|jgi:multimeric flavodoxin WrbA|nr:flavodoxin family protein [Lentisphaeria bacterium]
MTKVLLLTGSPRPHGSSSSLAEFVLDGMREAGDITVERVDTARLENKHRGCSSCYGCQPAKFRCMIHDATARLINRVHEFDVLVLATPVYFFNVSAQLKACTDRFMALCSYDEQGNVVSPLQKIRLAAVVTSEGDAATSGLSIVELWLKQLADFIGAAPIPILHQGHCGRDASPTLRDAGLRTRAMAFGRDLLA